MRPWFTLKSKSHRWWHWIFHPIRTYELMKYLKKAQKIVQDHVDEEEIERVFRDQMLFGTAIIEVEETEE